MYKVAGVVVLGAIMSILDITVVTVAIPTFQAEFDTSYAIAAWSMTGYTLALATVIPLTGWAADRFGTKRLYIMALTFFILGSLLCSTAWNIESLIAFRVLQGIGGGMLMPLGMTIMTHAAGPQRVGRVMAVLGVPMLLGPISGPILGGWLIDTFSWHWIFLINLPIGVVALILAFVVFDSDRPEPSESFDFLGMLLASPGLALFLFGVSSIPEQGTIASARVLIPALLGVTLLVLFVLHALRTEHPLIDLHLFRDRAMTFAVLTMVLFAIAFFGAGLLLPSYLQQVRGETALAAGLLIAPQGIGAMITMPIAGRLVDKIGPGKIVLTGITLMTIGMAFFTQLRGRHGVSDHDGRAVDHGLRHGLHDDADDDRGHPDADAFAGRPGYDIDEHRQPDLRLDRHRDHVGGADQPAPGQAGRGGRDRVEYRPVPGRETAAGHHRVRFRSGRRRVRFDLCRRRGRARAHPDPGVLPAEDQAEESGTRRGHARGDDALKGDALRASAYQPV